MSIIKFIQGTCCAFFLTGFAACGHVDEITPRAYVALLVVDTADVRDGISQALTKGEELSIAGPLVLQLHKDGTSTASVDFLWVTKTGAVVAHNKKYGVVLIQEPIISQGNVRWSCTVYPTEAKPNICGTE